jgi:hypothetical protein
MLQIEIDWLAGRQGVPGERLQSCAGFVQISLGHQSHPAIHPSSAGFVRETEAVAISGYSCVRCLSGIRLVNGDPTLCRRKQR